MTRTLETGAALLDDAARAAGEVVAAGSGWTGRLITPPYTFGAVDALVTNFHLPRSSLLFLVSALAGRENVLERLPAGDRRGLPLLLVRRRDVRGVGGTAEAAVPARAPIGYPALMIGRKLSHYQIVESLGAGGVGEVFRARDLHLERDVAIKVLLPGALDEAARERFRREAHALSRFAHPGVATVFDFDTQDDIDFLVMELVPGGTLAGRLRAGALPIDEAIELATGIAEALADAHGRGIIHRDLKPGNVVLTRAGTPKLLDFGLARLLDPARTQEVLTVEGETFGSLPYMAPEQLRGEADHPRVDVWALGVLLYEMLAGRRPFAAARPEALMHEILEGAPPSLRSLRPEVPPALERLVLGCLARAAPARPADAGAVVRELRSFLESRRVATTKGTAAGRRSLAVLPLDNVSRDPAQEYFADGMTEALISDLARLEGLRVISRTSVMKYKGTTRTLPEIARELSVDAVLEGSALLLGKRVRISVRLVSADTDETMWSERYDGDLEDVLDLMSRVAESVAKGIAVQLTPKEVTRLAEKHTVVPEAHLEYLKGNHELGIHSPDSVERALRHFRRALEIDPGMAAAWAGIAACHMARAARGMAPPAEAMAESLAAAKRSLELDPEGPRANALLGGIRLREGDWVAARDLYRRAVEVDPGDVFSLMTLGRISYCAERHAEALEFMLRALSLDPQSMLIHTAVGDALYYAREYEKSLVYYRRAVELDPRFDGAHTDLRPLARGAGPLRRGAGGVRGGRARRRRRRRAERRAGAPGDQPRRPGRGPPAARRTDRRTLHSRRLGVGDRDPRRAPGRHRRGVPLARRGRRGRGDRPRVPARPSPRR